MVRRAPSYKEITPEGMLMLCSPNPEQFFDEKAPKHFTSSTQMSAAVINASRFNAVRFETNPDPTNSEFDMTLYPTYAPCLEDFIIDFPSPDKQDALALVVFGLPNDALRLPLIRASDSQWTYGGFIQLPNDIPDITIIIVSELHGDVDQLCLSAEDLSAARSRAHGGVATISGTADTDFDPGNPTVRKLTLSLGQVMTRETFAAKGSINLSITLTNSGLALLEKHQVTEDLETLNEAINNINQALGLLEMDVDAEHREADAVRCAEAAKIPALKALGQALSSRFERLGRVDDVHQAIRLIEESLDMMRASFKITDEGNRITIPNRYLLSLGLDTTKLLPQALHSLGVALSRKFTLTGDAADIERAVDLQREAVLLRRMQQGDHKGVAGDETDLGVLGIDGRSSDGLAASLLARFGRSGHLPDIDEAIHRQRSGLELNLLRAHDGGSDYQSHLDARAWLQADLGAALLQRFKRLGHLPNLEEGIEHLRRAVELSRRSETKLRQQAILSIIGLLGVGLMRRFNRLGNLVDINEAISTQQLGLKLAPPDFAQRHTLLSNLALSLHDRFHHSKDLDSLYESIEIFHSALEATPDGHATLPLTLNNLATALRGLFEQTHEPSHLQEAILAQERAIKLSPIDHPDLGMLNDNLGSLFQFQFMISNDLVSIQRAIDSHRKALTYTTPETTSHPIILSALGEALMHRFRATGDESSIRESIEVIERSLELIPEGHSSQGVHSRALGDSYLALHSSTGDSSDMGKALSTFSKAAKSQTSVPLSRLSAARRWASEALIHHDKQHAIDGLDCLVSLLSVVAGMEQSVEHRYNTLSGLSFTTLNAASFAIQIGMLDKAVEWLEEGRGLVWNQLSSLRRPMDELELINPDLAHQLLDASRNLEYATQMSKISHRGLHFSHDLDERMSLHEQAAAHVRLAKEREQLLESVRTTVPGFEDFLRAQSVGALMENLPEDGPVVIINMHPVRCDALALIAGLDEPIHIPLPNFSWTQADKLVEMLQGSLESHGMRMRGDQPSLDVDSEAIVDVAIEDDVDENTSEVNQRGVRRFSPRKRPIKTISVIEEVLQLLWVDLISPILDGLALSASRESPTRIWWCPTGPLTSLPIHAAGVYRGPEPITLMDYAVSSYIPTISSLTDRVKRFAATVINPAPRIVLVSQPEYPGLTSIPGTTLEVDRIEQKLQTSQTPYLRLHGESATVDAGMRGMEDSSFVHLACHASQNHLDPLKSGFYLHGGMLELSTIVKSNLRSAEFAFLSACQTSKGTAALSEEAVHLAAGMLSAGYKSVVATMWSIEDSCAPQIANDFYEGRLGGYDGNGGVSGSSAAFSLHHALWKVRDRSGLSEREFLSWVPYVHFGL